MIDVELGEALERLDDWAADHPLDALRRGYAEYLSAYRLDAVAAAEAAAAMLYALDLLTPERRAMCADAARDVELTHFVPDRLEPERRRALGLAGRETDVGR